MKQSSSWISSILYKRCEDGATYIAVFHVRGAFLYGGPEHPIPSYLPGLLCAGIPKKDEKGYRHSIGRAYNKLLKGKYPYQEIIDREKVRELKEMMLS